MNDKEGNILSFKILIDFQGHLVTEFSELPEKYVHKIFSPEDALVIRKILREGKNKLDGLHDYLEGELDAYK
tara:strand:+ start:432 stop:647 length:216 start_codon:yes stop_codon:yes gene_type:complete